MNKLSAFIVPAFMSVAFAADAHTTLDDELAHSEMPDIQYYFCEGYHRDIDSANQILRQSQSILNNLNSTAEDKMKARAEVGHYERRVEEYSDALDKIRRTLDKHDYLHKVCGVGV